MDYEKKYKEALERAKQFSEKPYLEDSAGIVEYIFPELAESENEGIRKELITHCKNIRCVTEEFAERKAKWIAWLEKQGGITKLSEEEQSRFAKGVLSSCAMSFINYLDAHKYENKMCVSNGECEDIENAFHNAMWDRLHRYYCKYIEKQGEKSQAQSVMETWKDMRLEVYQQASGNRHEPNYSDDTTKMFSLNDIDEIIEKMSEQKPDNKVEIKFKIEKGKWYVCIKDLLDNYVNKAFYKGDTYLSTQDGSLMPSNSNIPFEVVCPDTYFRDWTIKDTKDGDVLYSKEHNLLWLHKNSEQCYSCINLNYANSISFGSDIVIPKDVYPATKEQRDTLMKAMTDAGWEFDFEKKELKKIEQPELTEFEDAVKDLMNTYRDAIGDCDATTEEVKKHAAYMLSLIPPKPTVGWRPAWSEEDEHRVKDTIYFLDAAKKHYASVIELDACMDWLKSLKQRIGE